MSENQVDCRSHLSKVALGLRNAANFTRTQLTRSTLLMGILLVGALTLGSPPVYASHGGTVPSECMVERFDENRTTPLGCTSNDVQLAQFNKVSGPASCLSGETIMVSLKGEFTATSAERWDVGMFVSTDGGTPNAPGGACYNDYLHPVSANNGDLDLLGGAGPFYNGEITDDPADMCGDIQQGNNAFFTTAEFPVICQDKTGNFTADVTNCTVWANSASAGTVQKPSCSNEADVTAGTTSKCTCGDIDVAGIEYIASAKIEVIKDLLPDSDPGLFDLEIDGTPQFSDASDGDTTGPVLVSASVDTVPGDTHTVGESAGTGTSLGDYDTAISCVDRGLTTFDGGPALTQADAGPLSVPVDPDDDVVCTITNTLADPCASAPDCSAFNTACGIASCDPNGALNNCDLLTPVPDGTVCNAGSGDFCDPDEVCDGINVGACPADSIAPAGTVCNPGSGDICDPEEVCSGVADEACPVDVIAPEGEVCNPGSGDLCDPDEVCTGVAGEACPADVFEPATTVCNEGSGDLCDPDELCTGNPDEACPADVVAPAGEVCNPGSGDLCDPDEVCSGVAGEACPADTVTPQGTVCNPGSGDLCDPDEVCSGVADEACPDDFVEPPTTVCNPSSTGDETCDPSEYCTCDPDVTCPADFIAPAGTACGDDSITDCSLPDTCDGAGTCEFNNRVCGSVTSSSLCEFDVEADKGTCVGGALDGAACSLALADENCIPVEGICEGGDLDGASCVIANGDADCTGGGVCAGAGVCEQSDQFRVAFAPDGHNWVAYKLNATTPGQFYYNAIYDASAASDGVTIGFDIPYPFVTQGATPLHVYDAELVGSNGEGCLAPENALVSEQTVILLDDWIQDGLSEPPYAAPDYLACDQVQGPGGSGFCILTFDIPQDVIDATVSGLLYVNLHLDFGLKGPHVDANPFDGFEDRYDRAAYVSPWGSSDALVNTDDNTGELALADCQAYDFSHADVGGVLESDTVENLNIFKKIAGAFGRAYCSDDDGALGVEMGLQRISDGEIVATAEIDGDGYYAVDYSHRGKPTEYRLVWTDGVNTHVTAAFGLKGNSWVEIDLTAVNACDDLDDPAPNDWLPIEPVCGPGNCK